MILGIVLLSGPSGALFLMREVPLYRGSLPIEYGSYKPVKTRFWHWLSGESPENVEQCSLHSPP